MRCKEQEMNNEIKQNILNKIREYDRIIITRHGRPDGDAIGSTKGLAGILRLSFPEKHIHVINEDSSEYLAFLGPEEPDIPDELYADALVIVLDTATLDRVSNKKIGMAREIIKIDHHINVSPYGSLEWVEDSRSSVCEMVADFYITFRDILKLDREAATAIYAGMVTDSGRFRYESVSGETLRCASVMLDTGIDTDTLFAHLYLKDFAYHKFQAYVLQRMKITENGVAYIHLTASVQERFHLRPEEASNVISFLDGIMGSIIWLAFIDNADGTTRVRLRSRFVTINKIAEHFHGGGHACASGATVRGRKELKALLAEADALSKSYKETHEGWL